MKLPVPLPAVRAAARAAAAKLAGRPLALGSTSSTRRALLAALDVPHRSDSPCIDEIAGRVLRDAAALVMAAAHAKAKTALAACQLDVDVAHAAGVISQLGIQRSQR